jgi:hypothetical protein
MATEANFHIGPISGKSTSCYQKQRIKLMTNTVSNYRFIIFVNLPEYVGEYEGIYDVMPYFLRIMFYIKRTVSLINKT